MPANLRSTALTASYAPGNLEGAAMGPAIAADGAASEAAVDGFSGASGIARDAVTHPAALLAPSS